MNAAVARPTPSFDLAHDSFGRLVLITAEGEKKVGVEPVRMFPYTDHDRWISIVDASGREWALIEDLAALPPPVRQKLEQELASREFVPIVERIVDISAEADPSEWTVVTDRGKTRFVLNSEDDIRRLGPTQALITDATGVRFHIPDTTRLDSASRRLLSKFL